MVFCCAHLISIAGPIDLLQKYSEILTNAFMTIKYCPFQETVPVSLQVCLTMSQKILETFEGIDKKDLNQEKIASTVSLKKKFI